MSTSFERLVRNQALFREVNQRINEVLDHSVGGTEYLCECSRTECTATIALTPEEYRDVRSHETRFFVALGHAAPAVERIVAENGRFQVVEKTHRPDLVADGEEDER